MKRSGKSNLRTLPLLEWKKGDVSQYARDIGLGSDVADALMDLCGEDIVRAGPPDRESFHSIFSSRLGSPQQCTAALDAFAQRYRKVILRVYDANGGVREGIARAILLVNSMTRKWFGGAFHCGVEVYGKEWAFGRAGIYSTMPLQEVMGHRLRESVPMPVNAQAAPSQCSLLDPTEVDTLADMMKKVYPAGSYDLLNRNCCSFANEFCQKLGVGPIPAWCNRAANVAHAVSTEGRRILDGAGNIHGDEGEMMLGHASQMFARGEISREEYVILRERTRRYSKEAGEHVPAQLHVRENSEKKDSKLRVAGEISL
eukprot:g3983.t1